MKKKLIFLFISFFVIKAYSNSFATSLKHKVLASDERFCYYELPGGFVQENEKYNLRIDIVKTDSLEILESLYFNIQYGNVFISDDARQMIISEKRDKNSGTYNYYLISAANEHVVKFLTTRSQVRFDKSCLYYVLSRFDEIKQVWEFSIYETTSGKIVRSFTWKIAKRIGGTCLVFRSINNEYDFMIDYCVENFYYGRIFYNIEKDKLYEVFNDSDLTKENERFVKHSLYELGRVSRPGDKIQKIK